MAKSVNTRPKMDVNIDDFTRFLHLKSARPYSAPNPKSLEHRSLDLDFSHEILDRIAIANQIDGVGELPKKPIAALTTENLKTLFARRMAGRLVRNVNGFTFPLGSFEEESELFARAIEQFEKETDSGRLTINELEKIGSIMKTKKSPLEESNLRIYKSIVNAIHTLNAQHTNPLSLSTLEDMRRRGILRIRTLIENDEIREAVSKLIGIKADDILKITINIEKNDSLHNFRSILHLREIAKTLEPTKTIKIADENVQLPTAKNKRQTSKHIDELIRDLDKIADVAIICYKVIANEAGYHEVDENAELVDQLGNSLNTLFGKQGIWLELERDGSIFDIGTNAKSDLYANILPSQFMAKAFVARSLSVVNELLTLRRALEEINSHVPQGIHPDKLTIHAARNILGKSVSAIREIQGSFQPPIYFENFELISTTGEWKILTCNLEKIIEDGRLSDKQIEYLSHIYCMNKTAIPYLLDIDLDEFDNFWASANKVVRDIQKQYRYQFGFGEVSYEHNITQSEVLGFDQGIFETFALRATLEISNHIETKIAQNITFADILASASAQRETSQAFAKPLVLVD